MLRLGIALKSKLSRLLTVGKRADLKRRSIDPPLTINQLQFDQPGKELDMIQPLGGTLAGRACYIRLRKVGSFRVLR